MDYIQRHRLKRNLRGALHMILYWSAVFLSCYWILLGKW
jgi:hypothetical protein